MTRSYLVMKLNGRHIWRSPKLTWYATGALSAAADIIAPQLFARIDGEVTFDVMDDKDILILQFRQGQELKKSDPLPTNFRIVIDESRVQLFHLSEEPQ